MMSPKPEVRLMRSSRCWVLAFVALVLGVPSGLSAFTSAVSGLRPFSPRSPSLVPRCAEADEADEVEVVDVEDGEEEEEPMDTEPEVKSVLDSGSNRYAVYRYKGRKYKVWPDKKFVNTATNETGVWNNWFKMPESEVERQRPHLMYQYFKKIRKIRRKMGDCRYRNGNLKFVVMMRRHPFTKEIYGEKYSKSPDWVHIPGEARHKSQKERARELQRKLFMEQEELRLEKLKAMGVWTGEPEWRAALVPEKKVRWRPRGTKGSHG